jgi:uncharacterized membrane protein YeaQ/YmgE (transglycosylase-associated protein family)
MELADIMSLGGGVGIFGTLFIGAIAGWIAERLTGSDHGLLTNIVMGILGSFVGGWLANAVGLQLGEIFQGWFWGNLIVSVVGAVLLITVYRMLRGRRA